jgi:hypothetical protein
VLGIIALVAYRRHKRTQEELSLRLAELIKALAEETDSHYLSLAYDKHLLRLIGSDADYEELIDYIEATRRIGHA